MAYTIEQLYTRACSLIDSLKTDGTVDTSITSDYRGRTLTLVDLALKKLNIDSDFYKTYEIAFKSVNNLLGYHFDVQAYDTSEDLTFECQYGDIKSYYFEADSNGGTAYIEDYTSGWNTLKTISLTNSTVGFQAYSGTVTPTTGAIKSRIRFSGTSHYNTINRALYDITFETSKIPQYKPWIGYQLPTDLKSIKDVVIEYENGIYTNDPAYKIETNTTRQTIYINYNFSGKVRVLYKPLTTIPTSFSDTLDIDDSTAIAICYDLAKNFVATEQNEFLVGFFANEYNQIRIDSRKKQPQGIVEILDFYGGI